MAKLTKVDLPLIQYFVRFRRADGSKFEVEMTGEDYTQLTGASAVFPTNAEGVFDCAYSCYRVASGEYVDTGSGLLMNDGSGTIGVPADSIVDDELTVDGVVLASKQVEMMSTQMSAKPMIEEIL